MQGGTGNDIYLIDSPGDGVTEFDNGGFDAINSFITLTLRDNIERLRLLGDGDIDGTGNDLSNSIEGNDRNNTLKGKDGKDTITGGLGNDRFVFDTGAAFNNTTIGLDTIKDFLNFSSEDDRLVLDKTTFTALKSVAGDGFSVGSEFAVVSSNSAAATGSALITYNKDAGALFYNQNGTAAGFGTGGQFASLGGHPALSAADLFQTCGSVKWLVQVHIG